MLEREKVYFCDISATLALQALEMAVGRAMGHLIIIGHDELLKKCRHAIYPVEYMDKSVGVRFGRAVAAGLVNK